MFARRPSFMFVMMILLCVGGSIAQVNFSGPQPGDVYKEFTTVMNVGSGQWRVTDPNLDPGRYPSAVQNDLPNPTLSINVSDLQGATRAEAVISLWGGHVGTRGKQIQFNGRTWLPIPEYDTSNGIPAGVAGELYLNQVNVAIPVPLDQLVQGTNTFTGTNTGQNPKYSFFWGMFGWYNLMIRVYYDPAQKPHPTGYISSPANYGIMTEDPTITASVSGNVNRVDFLGYYYGYDTDGNGKSTDYHYDYHLLSPSDPNFDIHNHVGTATSAPWQVTWNTRYVPDQVAGGVKLMARIRDNSGIWYCSPEVVNLSLTRTGTSVQMFQVTDLKERAWAKGDVGDVTNSVDVPSITGITEAVYHMRSYNMIDPDKDPGQYDYRRFNSLSEGPYGFSYYYSYDIRPLSTDLVVQGANTFSYYFSGGNHHGIEILWPGPALMLRYTGNYASPVPLASSLASPVSGSANQPTSPVLAWHPTPGGTSYQLQVSTDPAFGSTVFDQSNITDTTKQVGSLSQLTTFYWRVRATGPAGTGPYSTNNSFTTFLDAPTHLSPANAATNVPVSVTLQWKRSQGATSYKLQLSTDATFATGLVVNDSTITDTTYLATGLSFVTPYYWHVKAMGTAGGFSQPWTFTTVVGPAAAPVLTAPANGTQDLTVASINFSWQSAQWASTYRLQIATDPSFTSGIVFDDSTLTGTSRSVTNFQTDHQYYWRVRATGPGGTGSFSAAWSFQTVRTIPLATGLISPVNGTTGIPQSGLYFRWNSYPTATKYTFQLGTDSTFATGLFKNDTALVDTARLVNGLALATRYYWRVRVHNLAGWGPYSQTWWVTTVAPIPGPITLVGPSSGSIATADSGTFAWNRATPAASRYWYEIAIDSLFSSFRSVDSTLTDTIKIFRPLLNGQWYYWRVRGWSAGGWGPFSETRSLRVIVSSVSQRSSVPETFALEQNHPNPFNPSTKITFTLPKEAQVRLEVFNMLGQKVATLVDEHMEAGYYATTFDATNLPSGVYLYRLVTSSGSIARKMILMK
jgi:hypothetical protein